MVFSIERALVTPYTQTHTQPSGVINNLPVAGLLTVKAEWIKELSLVVFQVFFNFFFLYRIWKFAFLILQLQRVCKTYTTFSCNIWTLTLVLPFDLLKSRA